MRCIQLSLEALTLLNVLLRQSPPLCVLQDSDEKCVQEEEGLDDKESNHHRQGSDALLGWYRTHRKYLFPTENNDVDTDLCRRQSFPKHTAA